MSDLPVTADRDEIEGRCAASSPTRRWCATTTALRRCSRRTARCGSPASAKLAGREEDPRWASGCCGPTAATSPPRQPQRYRAE